MCNWQILPNLITLESKNRLYQCCVPIIGLTGGIASGKSTVSNFLKKKSFAIIDADQLIHQIYDENQTKEFIRNIDQELLVKEHINFKKLRNLFFSDIILKEKIENHLYAQMERIFNQKIKELDPSFVIYDVPLLFEKNLQGKVDLNVLVYASRDQQILRLKERDQTGDEVIEKILLSQIDIEEKKKQARYVIDNSGKSAQLPQEINKFLDQVFSR